MGPGMWPLMPPTRGHWLLLLQISMLVTYPAGIQHVQELVPWAYNSHEDVITAGYMTTGVLTASFVCSDLLYLVRNRKQNGQRAGGRAQASASRKLSGGDHDCLLCVAPGHIRMTGGTWSHTHDRWHLVTCA